MRTGCMKYFNTVGVTNPQKHYFLPHRLNWSQLREFVKKEYYFILHAPRQSGKTTAIKEFVDHLNQDQDYCALYMSTESAKVAVNDVERAVNILIGELKDCIKDTFGNKKIVWIEHIEALQSRPTNERDFYEILRFIAENSSKPVTIFLDEFDGLMGDSLIALLAQFRSGFTKRPQHFPQTMCLIGVRDLRDYKIKTKTQEELGVLYSPFNIKAESVVLPNFSLEDVQNLYLQHTQETGQQFTDEAIEYAHYLTQGQPWLVNALAYQACFRDITDRSITITKEIIDRSKEVLIERRDTHIDGLIDRLKESRIIKILDAVLAGTLIEDSLDDDLQYIRDLGLISLKKIEIANPIYKEVLPRALTHFRQENLPSSVATAWYVDIYGNLDMCKIIQGFQQFFRENSAIWLEKFEYKEAGPHLILMAWLQRIVNGGGTIYREYALGRGRVDLLIEWKAQRIVIELKILHGSKTVAQGLEQTVQYMDTSKATEGHLVIFDRDTIKVWEEKIYHAKEKIDDKIICVWGC